MFAVLFDDKFDLPLYQSYSKQKIAFSRADMVCKYTPCQKILCFFINFFICSAKLDFCSMLCKFCVFAYIMCVCVWECVLLIIIFFCIFRLSFVKPQSCSGNPHCPAVFRMFFTAFSCTEKTVCGLSAPFAIFFLQPFLPWPSVKTISKCHVVAQCHHFIG